MGLSYLLGIVLSSTPAVGILYEWRDGMVMMLFWILVLLALAGGVYWLFTNLFGNIGATVFKGMAVNTSGEALSILDKRYARGELDHDEYGERKRRLMEGIQNDE